jgi:hypothetical protein
MSKILRNHTSQFKAKVAWETLARVRPPPIPPEIAKGDSPRSDS